MLEVPQVLKRIENLWYIDEIRFWVLSWDTKATVISPESFKLTTQKEIETMPENYNLPTNIQ